MDGGEVGVLEQRDEVGLRGFLESQNSRRLEAEVGLEVLRNLTDKTLEGELADKELGRLLVATDLTERDGTGAVAVGLLDAAGRGGRLAGSLGGDCSVSGRGKEGGRWARGDLRCLRGALPPVDLRAVCLVRAIVNVVECVGVGVG